MDRFDGVGPERKNRLDRLLENSLFGWVIYLVLIAGWGGLIAFAVMGLTGICTR